MYSNFFFWYVLLSSFCIFLCFWALEFFWFLFLSKEAILKLTPLFVTTSDSHENLHLIGIHSTAVSMLALAQISYSSFGECLSDVSWRVSNLLRSLLVSEDHRAIGVVSRVFINGPGDRGSIPGRVIPKTQKMVLDTNTQPYKVRIKGKVKQSRKRSSALPYA